MIFLGIICSYNHHARHEIFYYWIWASSLYYFFLDEYSVNQHVANLVYKKKISWTMKLLYTYIYSIMYVLFRLAIFGSMFKHKRQIGRDNQML